WCVYEPLLSQEQAAATQSAFGPGARLIPKFDRADVILALDSDFLDCGQSDLESVRAFTSRRRVKSPADNMNRLYVVENRFTLTGAMADHRLRCPASQIGAFAHALAKKILAGTNDAGLGGLVNNLQALAGGAAFDERWLSEAANDLLTKPGASLVIIGANQLSRGRYSSAQSLACSGCALSGIMGRRAHIGWRLLLDSTNDPAALWRTFGNRPAQRAAWRSKNRRSRTCAGNFSRHPSAG